MPSRTRIASVAVVFAIAAGACSSDSGDEGAAFVETTPADADPTTAPATIGPSTSAAPITAAPTTTVAPLPDERPVPSDPAGLAAALSEAERMLRDPAVGADESAAWGRRQQRLYRELPRDGDDAAAVLAEVDADAAAPIRLNWTARQSLSSLVRSGPLSETLPAWRIEPPLPADELLAFYREAEAATGIEWEYLAAINLIETRMGRIDGLSTAGATGPMQFLPSTWAECCQGDPTIDRDAINGAAVYLVDRGGPDDMTRALFGYNPSDRYVEAVTAYAEVLRQDELAYRGYHAWEVYFLSAAGLVRMPVGYEETEPIDAAEWIAANPDALVAPPA
ncbi:MAG: lytic transglycosylase domain-containing protein [Actinomycetota bacterium]